MKTFIVPIDFSDTSKNAARFAARLAAEVPGSRIILFHVFDRIEAGVDGSVMFNDHQGRKKIMELGLESVKIDMLAISPGIDVTVYAEEDASLIEGAEKLARKEDANLIIMGITGATRLAQIFIGSNALSMIYKNTCPVMIVPPDASFTGIKNVVFTSDFKDVENTTPAKAIHAVLDIFKPFLHVVNVDADHYVELTEEYKAERAKLDKILEGYPKEYYFLRSYDFIEAINQFVGDHKIDLILTVPKHHSFLEGLFRSSYTKKLAYHSHVPLIAVHES